MTRSRASNDVVREDAKSGRHGVIAVAVIALLLSGCAVKSIDSSTSKSLDLCKQIRDEATRADCIVRVNETDDD